MKIYNEYQELVGELNKPQPKQYHGQWYEAVAFRPCKRDEYIFRDFLQDISPVYWEPTDDSVWIMCPIPTPTAAQLAAIGMRERDCSPVWCERGDIIWTGNCASDPLEFCPHCRESFVQYRWVLVPAEKPQIYCAKDACEGCTVRNYESPVCDKNKRCDCFTLTPQSAPIYSASNKYYSCEGCLNTEPPAICGVCFNPIIDSTCERKNYTPAPQPAPDTCPVYPPYRETIYEVIHDLNLVTPTNCYVSMAKTRLKNALAFQPAPSECNYDEELDCCKHFPPKSPQPVPEPTRDLLEMAWGIIANAHGGDWSKAPSNWQRAAEKWRDKYHAATLSDTPAPAPSEPVFTVGQIELVKKWLKTFPYFSAAEALGDIDDPADGLNAVTQKKGG